MPHVILIRSTVQWSRASKESMATGTYLTIMVQCNGVSKTLKLMVMIRQSTITKMVGCFTAGNGSIMRRATLIPSTVQWLRVKNLSQATGIYLITTVQCNVASKISKIMVTTKRFIITKMVGCNMVGSG